MQPPGCVYASGQHTKTQPFGCNFVLRRALARDMRGATWGPANFLGSGDRMAFGAVNKAKVAVPRWWQFAPARDHRCIDHVLVQKRRNIGPEFGIPLRSCSDRIFVPGQLDDVGADSRVQDRAVGFAMCSWRWALASVGMVGTEMLSWKINGAAPLPPPPPPETPCDVLIALGMPYRLQNLTWSEFCLPLIVEEFITTLCERGGRARQRACLPPCAGARAFPRRRRAHRIDESCGVRSLRSADRA